MHPMSTDRIQIIHLLCEKGDIHTHNMFPHNKIPIKYSTETVFVKSKERGASRKCLLSVTLHTNNWGLGQELQKRELW